MYYNPNVHNADELYRMFKDFKARSEQDGETAIALPNDITVLKRVSVETLVDIRDMIDEEIERLHDKETK